MKYVLFIALILFLSSCTQKPKHDNSSQKMLIEDNTEYFIIIDRTTGEVTSNTSSETKKSSTIQQEQQEKLILELDSLTSYSRKMIDQLQSIESIVDLVLRVASSPPSFIERNNINFDALQTQCAKKILVHQDKIIQIDAGISNILKNRQHDPHEVFSHTHSEKYLKYKMNLLQIMDLMDSIDLKQRKIDIAIEPYSRKRKAYQL